MHKPIGSKSFTFAARQTFAGLLAAALAMAQSPAPLHNQGHRSEWNAASQAPLPNSAVRARAKNVILMIGDGMNVPTVTAARILEAQLRGEQGEENLLAFERFPNAALVKTYAADAQVTDSSSAMTAMVTGFKTNNGVLSVGAATAPGDWQNARANQLTTILEYAEWMGMSTGVVSTTRVTHATPAACFAHSAHRDWESDREVPAAAKGAGIRDIARQLVEFPIGDGLEVALGGGRSYFMPAESADPEYAGKSGRRTDKVDLTKAWESRGTDWRYVWNEQQFRSIDPRTTGHLLGLFEQSHMLYEHDRKTAGGEPSLTDMTIKAIQVLKKNPNGFFLMVEGGRIDHAHHAVNAYRALTDTIEFSNAVGAAMTYTQPHETLIVVTADHGHVLSIAGYPEKGNPILGLVKERGYSGTSPQAAIAKDLDGMPYTTLAYGNGPNRKAARLDLSTVDTTSPDYLQESAIRTAEDTHSGEDMPLYAAGAGSEWFRGVLNNTDIYGLMLRALGWDWQTEY